MVEVRIWIEGGTLAHDNASAAVLDNSQRFRESFKKLFSQIFNEDQIKIIIENGAGEKNTVKLFKANAHKTPESFVLLDLDGPPSSRAKRLDYFDLNAWHTQIFFMIQAMEAWILSQPDVIEICLAKYKKDSNASVASDNLFVDKKPEQITHPDRVLEIVISRYFQEERKGVVKKLKYGKLKTAPDLIEKLDLQKLSDTFEDVQQLIKAIKNTASLK